MLAEADASHVPIKVLSMPVPLPPFLRIYWHERYHHDAPIRLPRKVFVKLFRARGSGSLSSVKMLALFAARIALQSHHNQLQTKRSEWRLLAHTEDPQRRAGIVSYLRDIRSARAPTGVGVDSIHCGLEPVILLHQCYYFRRRTCGRAATISAAAALRSRKCWWIMCSIV